MAAIRWCGRCRARGEEIRRRDIERTLPEALEVIALVMQSGLDFQAGMRQYVGHGPPGVLRDELARVLTDIRAGASRVEALRHLAERVPGSGLAETAQSLIQTIQLGAGLVPVLRAQAGILRQKRLHAAEKQAALAPLKLMVPLFLFIFPTILITLLGPIALAVLNGAFS